TRDSLTLPLHDALPILTHNAALSPATTVVLRILSGAVRDARPTLYSCGRKTPNDLPRGRSHHEAPLAITSLTGKASPSDAELGRSEEHTSELQSRENLV